KHPPKDSCSINGLASGAAAVPPAGRRETGFTLRLPAAARKTFFGLAIGRPGAPRSGRFSNPLLMILCEFAAPGTESRDMSDGSEAILEDRYVQGLAPPVEEARAAHSAGPLIDIVVHDDLNSIEPDWRRFQESADCTVFQTFEWLAAWQCQIGRHEGSMPAIVVGRRCNELLFLIPLAVMPGVVRRLTFLGSDLGDYNAPLLARDFSEYVKPEDFHHLRSRICTRLAREPRYRYDLVDLTKMPQTVGDQANPFLTLGVALHPSGAHLMHLQG